MAVNVERSVRPWRRISVPLSKREDDALIHLAGEHADCDYRALVLRFIREGIDRLEAEHGVS
jgi:hypothetical protein